jgi:DNA-binding NarL/FixJ family response regulator
MIAKDMTVDNFPLPQKKVREKEKKLRNNKVKRMYNAGYSMMEIAHYLSISKATVHAIIHSI